MRKTFLRYYFKRYLKDEEKKTFMHIFGGWGNVLGRRMWENSRFTEELNKAPGSGRMGEYLEELWMALQREAGSGTWKTLQVIAVTFKPVQSAVDNGNH